MVVDREIARIHDRIYGFPRLVGDSILASQSTFYFVEYDSTRVPTALEFPRHSVERMDKRLYRVYLK